MSRSRTWQDHAKALGIDESTVQAGPTPPLDLAAPLVKPNKYHAVKTVYNGRHYASRREAARAQELDALVASGVVVWWEPQPKVWLGPARLPYAPDFLVIGLQDDWWFEEVKGVVTQRFRDVLRLWAIHGPAPLRVIYRDRTEIITPGPAVRYPDDDSEEDADV